MGDLKNAMKNASVKKSQLKKGLLKVSNRKGRGGKHTKAWAKIEIISETLQKWWKRKK